MVELLFENRTVNIKIIIESLHLFIYLNTNGCKNMQ